MKLKNAIFILTAFSILLVGAALLVHDSNPSLVYRHTWLFIIYFYFLSAITLSLLNFAVAKNKGNFALFFFGSMIVRFFLSIIIVFIIMFVDRQNLVIIATNFVIAYLLFLGLDIFLVAASANRHPQKDQDINVRNAK